MHPVFNNTFLFRELYFDVDYEMETFEQSAAETKKLLEWYRAQDIVSEQEPVVVFSGGKGFHLIDFGWKLEPNLHGSMKKHYEKLFERGNKHPPSAKLQRLDKAWKTWFVKQVKRDEILIDYDVTPDPRRIIRLPGTIHGKKGGCAKSSNLMNWTPSNQAHLCGEQSCHRMMKQLRMNRSESI